MPATTAEIRGYDNPKIIGLVLAILYPIGYYTSVINRDDQATERQMIETTQILESFAGSMKISRGEMCDKRPESKTPAKLAAISAMVLPETHTGRIDVIQGSNRVTFWGRGEAWGKTIIMLINAGNTAEVEVFDGGATITQH